MKEQTIVRDFNNPKRKKWGGGIPKCSGYLEWIMSCFFIKSNSISIASLTENLFFNGFEAISHKLYLLLEKVIFQNFVNSYIAC